jgi:hypothetical protein
VWLAKNYLQTFGTLLGKVLPMQVEGSDLAGTYDLSGHQRQATSSGQAIDQFHCQH